MKKEGFTLIELIAVIAIASVLVVASFVMFNTDNEKSEEDDLRNKYKEIQTAAILYVDLNSSWLTSFTTTGEAYVRLGELQNENYVSENMTNPVTGEEIPSDYLIKVYTTNLDMTNPNAYADSCIISTSGGNTKCIANANGYACGCCDFEITSLNPACSN